MDWLFEWTLRICCALVLIYGYGLPHIRLRGKIAYGDILMYSLS